MIFTNTSSPTLQFLNNNFRTETIPVFYSDNSIRIESIDNNISSVIYSIFAFEYYINSEYATAVEMFKNVTYHEKEKTILLYIGNCYLFEQIDSNNNL